MRALITGASGQDGSYLSEFLLGKGYEVFGTIRFSVSPNTKYIDHLRDFPNFKILHADMQDGASLERAVQLADPDEVYNLAAISFAPVSWEIASQTMDVNATGLLRLIESVRRIKPNAKIYQASTSEQFGSTRTVPQNETTPFNPVHPYGASKLAAHNAARVYREQYGMFISCGILSNHESERRGKQFVTRKVTSYVAALGHSKATRPLELWTLKPRRDWGYSPDYVRAMWMILQNPTPDDFVIGTGIDHSIKDLVETAFHYAGFDWEPNVMINPPSYFKPDEDSRFLADYSKAKRVLGWEPTVTFTQMIGKMVDNDYNLAK